MSRQLSELEQVLQQLIAEHRRLLAHVDAQQQAMRKLDLNAIDTAASAQEASRLRIAMLDAKRRNLVAILARPQQGAGVQGAGGTGGAGAKNARNIQSSIASADSQSQIATRKSQITLKDLAHQHPQRRDTLLALGKELREVAAAIQSRSKVAGKLAAAVLGHLNTVVRLLAGAVEGTRPQTYTKQGVPRAASRIGIMEAVG